MNTRNKKPRASSSHDDGLTWETWWNGVDMDEYFVSDLYREQIDKEWDDFRWTHRDSKPRKNK